MKNNSAILQHYPSNERDFVKSCLAMQQEVLQNGRPKITSFLTMREQEILTTIIGKQANLIFDSGIENGERKIAIISEYEITNTQVPITIIEIIYHKKFGEIKHSDVLGSILGLGLERKVIGDIVVTDNNIFVAVQKSIANYLLQELTKIGRHSVQTRLYDDTVIRVAETLNYKMIHVSSLRLDSLVSHVLPCNREQAKEYISKDFVQLNWITTKNINQSYTVGDIISVRRFGRIYIDKIIETRRNRFKIEVRIT